MPGAAGSLPMHPNPQASGSGLEQKAESTKTSTLGLAQPSSPRCRTFYETGAAIIAGFAIMMSRRTPDDGEGRAITIVNVRVSLGTCAIAKGFSICSKRNPGCHCNARALKVQSFPHLPNNQCHTDGFVFMERGPDGFSTLALVLVKDAASCPELNGCGCLTALIDLNTSLKSPSWLPKKLRPRQWL